MKTLIAAVVIALISSPSFATAVCYEVGHFNGNPDSANHQSSLSSTSEGNGSMTYTRECNCAK